MTFEQTIYDNFIKPSIPYILSIVIILSIVFLICELANSDTKEERIHSVVKTLILLIVLIISGIILMYVFSVIALIVVIFIVLIVFADKF